MAVIAFLFGAFMLPLAVKFQVFIFGGTLRRPNWNDNPLTFTRPLSVFLFLGFLFAISGLAVMLGEVMRTQAWNGFGLFYTAFGAGCLIGVWFLGRRIKPTP